MIFQNFGPNSSIPNFFTLKFTLSKTFLFSFWLNYRPFIFFFSSLNFRFYFFVIFCGYFSAIIIFFCCYSSLVHHQTRSKLTFVSQQKKRNWARPPEKKKKKIDLKNIKASLEFIQFFFFLKTKTETLWIFFPSYKQNFFSLHNLSIFNAKWNRSKKMWH